MKLDFNQVVIGIDGKEIIEDGKPVKLAPLLANLFAQANSQEPAKFIDWAVKLMGDGKIEVDKSDSEKIKNFVSAHNGLSNLGKCRILEIINAAKEDEPKEGKKKA